MRDVIADLKEADKIIKGQGPERCVWCGCDLKLWKVMLGEQHAKDAVCNSKEKEAYDLIIDLAENYDRGNGSPDSPDPRKVLNLIARIVKS